MDSEERMKIDGTLESIRAQVLRLYEVTGATAFFDAPLVGVAAADDPLFIEFKRVAGPAHWTPREALALAAPGAEARSVIVWALPIRAAIRAENATMADRPSTSWAATRSFGELCNEQMRAQLRRLLEAAGRRAAAPHLEQVRRGYDIVAMNFTSHWSERHAAFAAGLGTFGLSAGLITERGVAVRIGSIVTDLDLPSTPRPYGDDPFAWCIQCGACARRCPASAIGRTPAQRDKPACGAYCAQRIAPGRETRYGWLDLNLGCGLCQTAVPCESRRPCRGAKQTS